MPEDNDNPLTSSPQQIQPTPDQLLANSATLMIGKHSHGGQCHSRDGTAACFDRHSAEHYVSDDAPIHLGDEGEEYGTLATQAIDQIGFVRTTESRFVNCADHPLLPSVLGAFTTDDHIDTGTHGLESIVFGPAAERPWRRSVCGLRSRTPESQLTGTRSPVVRKPP